MKKTVWIGLLIPLLLAGGCKKGEKTEAEMAAAGEPSASTATTVEPDKVEVQHILISFKGASSRENVTRTQDEAEALAREILERAMAGEDFDALVKQYTDDQYPGIYRMANLGIEADEAANEFLRTQAVKAFGDVGFSLAVGEIGSTVYDPETSKFGWHIIKRLK